MSTKFKTQDCEIGHGLLMMLNVNHKNLLGGVLLLLGLSVAEFPLYVAALVAGGGMFCWPPALFFILLAAGGVVVVEAVRGCCFLCLDTSHLQDNALHIWHSVCF